MITRYFGLDLHKRYGVAAAVDGDHQVCYPATRVSLSGLEQWAAAHLTRQDEVVVEVGTNTWQVVDLLRRHVRRVVVANPYKTRLIAQAHIKNDRGDALTLAHLLVSGFVYQVWVPPAQVREQRGLVTHRASLQKQSTRVKNRLHNLLTEHGLRCPEPSLFSRAGRGWLQSLPLSALEALQVAHWLAQLDLLQQQLDEADRLLARLAARNPRVPRLMQVTGVGYLTAFAALALIGDIRRFPTADRLAAYVGLVPRQHQSGNRCYHGRITKTGNRLLRALMVEAARVAIRYDSHWRRVHGRIARRRGTNIATVAVARKLVVLFWHLLQQPVVYAHLRPQTFVTKLQTWAYRIGAEHLPTETAEDFVRHHLTALGLHQVARALRRDKRNGRLRIVTA